MKRNVFSWLADWQTRSGRRPLIIKGARQVGKSYIVRRFGKENFADFIELNLNKQADRQIFSEVSDASKVIERIELRVGRKIRAGQCLIFIDEIQESEIALQQLRYFYEEVPELHVIAAGSLLDAILRKNTIEIPVGRVEYCHLLPMSFFEFVQSAGNEPALQMLTQGAFEKFADLAIYSELEQLFDRYLQIGGMPAVVAQYWQSQNLFDLRSIYEALLEAYVDDIGKYSTPAQAVYVRHCLENAPAAAGMQISYKHFAQSNFGSREISLAFDALESAHLVHRVWGARALTVPLVANKQKSPKLCFLDTGLVVQKLGLVQAGLAHSQIESVVKGQILEQFVAQELLGLEIGHKQDLYFWYRDQPGSNAEVDFVIQHQGNLLPIEVKFGAAGNLRSLHSFIDETGQAVAVRLYRGPYVKEELMTQKGRKFTLFSLPVYLAARVKGITSA